MLLVHREGTMSETGPAASPSATMIRRLARLGRFVFFLCTAGWAYPHVCTETLDLTKIQNEHMARRG
jgi:hypothetical protein